MASPTEWNELPDHIIVNILSYLPLADRCTAALVCRSWAECFDEPSLWRRFVFRFLDEADSVQLCCLERHGCQLRSAEIYLNQKELVNRQNACQVLTSLARCPERRLEEISVSFLTENPFFFQGLEFLTSLAELFGPPDPRSKVVATLTKVDLSGLSVTYRDELLYLLADNHPTLEELNLQNTSLMCCISPGCLQTVLRKCLRIGVLSVHYRSTSEEVFTELSAPGRLRPLGHLSLACTREEKYHKVIPAAAWQGLASRHPGLRVCIKFDHTIERHRILAILDPAIPLVELHMRTMTDLQEEVATVAGLFHPSLECLSLVTKGTAELQRALLDLVERSQGLHTLHCYCALDQSTIDRIRSLRPHLRNSTLKTAEEFDLLAPTLTDLKECLESVWSNWFPSVRAMRGLREPPF